MPKTTTITKEMIINSTFEIVREEGFYNISARKIAKKIGCSTQPIYWVYNSMDDLIRDVVNKVVSYLSEILKNYQKSGKPFLDYRSEEHTSELPVTDQSRMPSSA